MVKTTAQKLLTNTEEQLLETLKDVNTVSFAANKIGIKTRTAYNILYRLRKKYVKARRFVNYIEAQKRGHTLIKMVLTDRVESEAEEAEE